MTKNFSHILQSIFFSWIIFLGFIYAQADCYGFLYSVHFQEFSQDSEAKADLLNLSNVVHHQNSHIFINHNQDNCCTKASCDYQGKISYNSHFSGIKNQPEHIANAGAATFNAIGTLNPIFNQFRFSQTVSIYILTQSFLC
ncbi:MAG: hypothetical protein GXP56_02945 [Deltaproteobacteria bacterium]|nr:hypothetical protein [Deltaproteobacteria bacterium]